MIYLDNYLKNPCLSLSIPYWKAKNISVPDNMKIVHESGFSAELLKEYEDETYFRLYHSMKKLTKPEPEGYDIIKELLWRGREYAKFATVSGKVENKTKPEALYRKCGFIGNDVWHILRKK